MKVFLHRLSDEDPEAKSNAAYATGMLCLNSRARQVVVGNYGSILSKLEPLLQVRNHRMLDNACGCIARMIMAHPNNVNLPDVLPVYAGILPLKEDYEENEPIYKMLVQLCLFSPFVFAWLAARLTFFFRQEFRSNSF
jgi:hypothetical protein